MEMPSKKDYPTYYKEIKRPQSLENIYVRIATLVLPIFIDTRVAAETSQTEGVPLISRIRNRDGTCILERTYLQ